MGHIVHMGETTYAHKFWSQKIKERDHLEDLGINGLILEWILEK